MVEAKWSQYMVDDAIISNSNTDMAISKRPIFPVVGIGASGGGLAAFEAFFNVTLQLLEPAEPRGYRIHKRVRDLLVFSEQNVIKDPPFSKLDLISCRNRLIYLGSA